MYKDLTEKGSVLGALLDVSKQTVSTGESCTGGLVFHTLTNTPGASRWCVGGMCAYTWEMKIKLLGVNLATLQEHTAESEAVAREMAQGAARTGGSTWGIATTGFTGPGNPLDGTVYIAVAGPYHADGSGMPECVVQKIFVGGDRQEVKIGAAMKVLDLLCRQIQRFA